MGTWIANGTFPAVLITVGVAIFLFCCLGCRESCSKEDPIFRRHNQ
jgi:hypothetical protein